MQIPSCKQRATCYHVTMEIPKVVLDKQICALQNRKPSQRGRTICSGLVNGIAHGQADRSPLVLLAPQKLRGKALVLCGPKERERPIPMSRSVTWGDGRWHPVLGDICVCNQPNSTRVCKPPGCPKWADSNNQDTICSVQPAVSVGGRGLFCSFYGLIYGLFT